MNALKQRRTAAAPAPGVPASAGMESAQPNSSSSNPHRAKTKPPDASKPMRPPTPPNEREPQTAPPNPDAPTTSRLLHAKRRARAKQE